MNNEKYNWQDVLAEWIDREGLAETGQKAGDIGDRTLDRFKTCATCCK